ncbi:unnamed protein product [Ceutorhynchus assimilis]|uniref:Uncharacterized protein n=1 Tax=Ceutorhynchus assimilis TaxID=467358 RepID=A0A9N9MX80_9CUCU|nr:unnamed protein product [Ceutorhynchus assimilis]
MFTNHLRNRLNFNAVPTIFPTLEGSSKAEDHSYRPPPLIHPRSDVPEKIKIIQDVIMVPKNDRTSTTTVSDTKIANSHLLSPPTSIQSCIESDTKQTTPVLLCLTKSTQTSTTLSSNSPRKRKYKDRIKNLTKENKSLRVKCRKLENDSQTYQNSITLEQYKTQTFKFCTENCEADGDQMLVKLNDIPVYENPLVRTFPKDPVQEINDYQRSDILEKNFVRYVCGYLLKKGLNLHCCEKCQQYSNAHQELDDTSLFCFFKAYENAEGNTFEDEFFNRYKQQRFKSLSVDVRHEILINLKETRKQNSWGRLHELPAVSDDFSVYQMKILLKKQAVQAALEEAEKEMGGKSVAELELILKDQGVFLSGNNSKDIEKLNED